MIVNRAIASLVTASLLATTSGCSFAFVHGPGDVGDPPRVYPDCSESYAWPVVDGLMGLFSLAFAANPGTDRYDSSTGTYQSNNDNRDEQVLSGLLMAAAFVGGAIYGYTRVSSCKEARAAFTASAAPPQPYYAPQPYYPQPYPGQQQPYYPPQQPQQPYYPPQQQPMPPQQPMGPQQPAPPMGPQQPQQPMQPQQPAVGSEGAMCLPNNACNAPGLVCASGICVRPGAR